MLASLFAYLLICLLAHLLLIGLALTRMFAHLLFVRACQFARFLGGS